VPGKEFHGGEHDAGGPEHAENQITVDLDGCVTSVYAGRAGDILQHWGKTVGGGEKKFCRTIGPKISQNEERVG